MNALHLSREKFLLDNDIRYLNCANMSPMLKAVKNAGLLALDKRAFPWKIAGPEWFSDAEILRTLAANIFNTSNNHITLIPSASYGLALAAKNLSIPPGKEIVILEQQFPSNYYVWETIAKQQQLKIVTVNTTGERTLTQAILDTINANTGIVAIPNCHWIIGSWIDLVQVSESAKRVGSFLVLDLSQSLGVLPTDIHSIDPDFAISVGYKWMLGPYGMGYMYIAERWQEKGEPLEYSWQTKKGSDDFSNLTNYTTEYKAGARKFDMGAFPQFNLMPMAIAGLQQVVDWDVKEIQAGIQLLTNRINDWKSLHGLLQPGLPGVGHITSVGLARVDVAKLHTCLNENNIFISFRGNSIRVSPHLYNTMEEVDELLAVLDECQV